MSVELVVLNMFSAIVHLAGVCHPRLVICYCLHQQDLCLLGQKHVFGCHDLCVAATMPLVLHQRLLFSSAIFVCQPQQGA